MWPVIQSVSCSGNSPGRLVVDWLADWLAPLSFPLRAILFLLGVLIVGRALFPTAALLQSKEVGLAKVCRYFPLSLCLADVEETRARAWPVWRSALHARGYYVRLYVYLCV